MLRSVTMQDSADQRTPRPATRSAGARRIADEHAVQRALVVASLITCPKSDARRR
jgi:hypothetical protein